MSKVAPKENQNVDIHDEIRKQRHCKSKKTFGNLTAGKLFVDLFCFASVVHKKSLSL
jgi:hypothetical protein